MSISQTSAANNGSLYFLPENETSDFIVRDFSNNNALYIDSSAGNVGI
jgi:hypothetical protein